MLLHGGHTRLPQCASQLSRSKDPGSSKGCRCYHCELCHDWALMPQSCRRGAGATPVFSEWLGASGETLKSSVLVREVSQWRPQEEKNINPCCSLDLCYWGTYLDLRLWNLLLKHPPPPVIAGGCAGITYLCRGTTKVVTPTLKSSCRPLLCDIDCCCYS